MSGEVFDNPTGWVARHIRRYLNLLANPAGAPSSPLAQQLRLIRSYLW